MRDRLRFHPLVPTSQRTHTHEGSSLSVRSVRLHGISLSLFTFFARPLPFFRLSRSPFTFISVRDSYLPGSRATSTCILLYKEFKLSINFHRLANRCERRAFQRTWNLDGKDEPPLSPSIDPRALSRSIEWTFFLIIPIFYPLDESIIGSSRNLNNSCDINRS